MNKIRIVRKPFITVLLLSAAVACQQKPPEPQNTHTVVSEKPSLPELDERAITTAQASVISTRARVSYQDLATFVESQIPQKHNDTGEKSVCKRVLGMKICGTAKWRYTVTRDATVAVSGENNQARISLPLRFEGVAGLNGDTAKLLKLQDMNFSGALDATLWLGLDLSDDWCPIITSQVSHQWTEAPSIEWAAGIDFNLQSKLDEAIAEQLKELQAQLNNAIDCGEFRQSIEQQWHSHSIELQLSEQQPVYLNVFPTAFAFSGMQTEADKLGMAFSLSAETTVLAEPIIETREALPAVERIDYSTGKTVFELLIYADYTQLQTLLAPELINKTFSETTPAGDVSVNINSVDISGNHDGITLALDFSAKLPASSKSTTGTLYLTAAPTVDPQSNTISLNNIELSNVLDSTLWNTIANVFKNQIIAQIEKNAVLNLDSQMRQLEQQLHEQLSDTKRTAGLQLQVNKLQISLQKLVPEQTALVAVIRAESELEIEVPIAALNQLQQQH